MTLTCTVFYFADCEILLLTAFWVVVRGLTDFHHAEFLVFDEKLPAFGRASFRSPSTLDVKGVASNNFEPTFVVIGSLAAGRHAGPSNCNGHFVLAAAQIPPQ